MDPGGTPKLFMDNGEKYVLRPQPHDDRDRAGSATTQIGETKELLRLTTAQTTEAQTTESEEKLKSVTVQMTEADGRLRIATAQTTEADGKLKATRVADSDGRFKIPNLPVIEEDGIFSILFDLTSGHFPTCNEGRGSELLKKSYQFSIPLSPICSNRPLCLK